MPLPTSPGGGAGSILALLWESSLCSTGLMKLAMETRLASNKWGLSGLLRPHATAESFSSFLPTWVHRSPSPTGWAVLHLFFTGGRLHSFPSTRKVSEGQRFEMLLS